MLFVLLFLQFTLENFFSPKIILQLAESGTIFGQADLFKVRGKFALSDSYEDHFILPKGMVVVITHRRVLLLQVCSPLAFSMFDVIFFNSFYRQIKLINIIGIRFWPRGSLIHQEIPVQCYGMCHGVTCTLWSSDMEGRMIQDHLHLFLYSIWTEL